MRLAAGCRGRRRSVRVPRPPGSLAVNRVRNTHKMDAARTDGRKCAPLAVSAVADMAGLLPGAATSLGIPMCVLRTLKYSRLRRWCQLNSQGSRSARPCAARGRYATPLPGLWDEAELIRRSLVCHGPSYGGHVWPDVDRRRLRRCQYPVGHWAPRYIRDNGVSFNFQDSISQGEAAPQLRSGGTAMTQQRSSGMKVYKAYSDPLLEGLVRITVSPIAGRVHNL